MIAASREDSAVVVGLLRIYCTSGGKRHHRRFDADASGVKGFTRVK
jgi:hypothetical protein